MGFDVSEAVPLTAPSIPAAPAEHVLLAVRTRLMCGFARFGSEQSRPTSALCLGLGFGLRVGQRTRAQHGPTVIRRMPRGGWASRSVEAEPSLLLGRAARAARATGAARGRFVEGPGRDSGGLSRWARRPAGGEAGAQDGGASRCQFGQAPTWRLEEWEARESTRRLVSTEWVQTRFASQKEWS
jgi:hypothetical protein